LTGQIARRQPAYRSFADYVYIYSLLASLPKPSPARSEFYALSTAGDMRHSVSSKFCYKRGRSIFGIGTGAYNQ
jgi:hypothetical protein